MLVLCAPGGDFSAGSGVASAAPILRSLPIIECGLRFRTLEAQSVTRCKDALYSLVIGEDIQFVAPLLKAGFTDLAALRGEVLDETGRPADPVYGRDHAIFRLVSDEVIGTLCRRAANRSFEVEMAEAVGRSLRVKDGRVSHVDTGLRC